MNDDVEATESTLAFYAENVDRYAARSESDSYLRFYNAFVEGLTAGARVLDLGCGAGWAAKMFSDQGFDTYAVDGCPELAKIASAKIKREVEVMRFEDLAYDNFFDGIFANATLHHLPRGELPNVLNCIARALRPKGKFFASFKHGDGEHKDTLGRFYSYYQKEELRQLIENTNGLNFTDWRIESGIDFSGRQQNFLGCFATKD
ncbi:MAG: class I SAM-dependent methyltransferase [Hyphomicrobiales bacterium]|nr:class I SAM-dependent methyltransferase [Hyphomicrobiales bacterium]